MKNPLRPATKLAITATTILLTSACALDTGPPERDFNQTQAYEILHDSFHENIEYMDDFPGFEIRRYSKLECESPDGTSTDFVRMEIAYVFSWEDSETEKVRDDYFEALKEAWDEAGYDIHRDDVRHEGDRKNLEAKRPDGVNYWYRVWDRVRLYVQSGCVQATEITEPYIPPIDHVEPKNDQMHKYKDSDESPSDD